MLPAVGFLSIGAFAAIALGVSNKSEWHVARSRRLP